MPDFFFFVFPSVVPSVFGEDAEGDPLDGLFVGSQSTGTALIRTRLVRGLSAMRLFFALDHRGGDGGTL